MKEAVFYVLAGCIAVSAVLSVAVRDIFHGAIWLAMTLLGIAFLYFYLDAGFLGVIQVLVYVGGIMALFVFAIMLTARIGDQSVRQVNRRFWPGLVLSGLLLVACLRIILTGPWSHVQASGVIIDLKTIGKSMVTAYALPFEFISLLLLIALVGAVVIGKVKQ